MTKNRKWLAIGLLFLFLAGIGVVLYCINQEGFSGSRVKNPDSFLLDIERMNGTDMHSLELHKDDVLQIRFETIKGSMYMEIKAPDGTLIYSGNGKELSDFTVTIPETGVYTITLKASHASGTLHIQLEE